MSESRGIDYKHGIRRKNRPFWQCSWVRALWPTIAGAEPDSRAQGRIGSRSSPIGWLQTYQGNFKSEFVSKFVAKM
jgi:hypothetical protein